MTRNTRKRRKSRAIDKPVRNKGGYWLVLIVASVMVIGVGISCKSMSDKIDAYKVKEQSLMQQIEQEQARTEEISEYAKYVQTDKFVEEIAKEKLGLVYEDEIVFKKER